MPFGLTDALAVITDLMHRGFKPHLDQFVVAFIDGISGCSKVRENHERHLMRALQTPRGHQFLLSSISVSLNERNRT